MEVENINILISIKFKIGIIKTKIIIKFLQQLNIFEIYQVHFFHDFVN